MSAVSRAPVGAMLQWTGVALLSAVVSFLAVRLILGVGWRPEAAAGWGVAAANAAMALIVNRFSVCARGRKFPLRGIFFNLLRFFILLGMVVVAWGWLGGEPFRAFLVAMIPGYFVLLVGEIIRLHRSDTKGQADI